MASSSSSSSTRGWTYDVFLSFRGTDTRKGIAYDIRDRLKGRGIRTFMDDEGLQVGDVISPTLLAAIKESKFAIIVLSKNYASSAWCLEELREICVTMGDNRILPLFFDVNPTDVRYQKKSFEEAFSKHDANKRHEPEKVQEWRDALKKVANISGWHSDNFKSHRELVDKIAEDLRSKVPPDPIESTGDFQAFEATKQAMVKVMEALTDDKSTAIAVHGMGGVGKTAMVKKVAAQACKNGTFEKWIIVAISQCLDLKKVQGTVADFLGVKLVEESECGRAATLHRVIISRRKLLIILDDVWERTELSKIGIPDFKELQKCNSKVVVTTRKISVCYAMKITAEHRQVSILLDTLSKEDSLTLFRRNAGITESTTFENAAKRVARECKGLPVALIALAKALGGKDLEEWENAAQRLEQSQCANPDYEESDQNAVKCIRLSFDHLKNEDCKLCFLLCSLFPEDHDIKIEDQLFRYTIGKRLFQDAQTMKEVRGRVVTAVKYLRDSSLLLASEIGGRVKMHDVVRDTALNIAQHEDGYGFFVKAGCGLKVWPHRVPEGCTAISLMNNKIHKLPEEESVFSNLQILLLNGNKELCEIPEKTIQYLKEVRVLDLSDTSISVLPQSFSLLTNLQALYLDNCDKLEDISAVGKLEKLEILSMRGCHRVKFSEEIGHLTSLRILDVSSEGQRVKTSKGKNEGVKNLKGNMVNIPTGVISKLQNLEELYIVYCGFEDASQGRIFEEVDEKSNVIRFDEIAGLENLKIFQAGLSESSFYHEVVAAPQWDYFLISINGDEYSEFGKRTNGWTSYLLGDHKSRRLCLNGVVASALPDWFTNAVYSKTEKLYCIRCRGIPDIVHKLPNLERLHLNNMLELEFVFGHECFEPKQPKLREMELVSLEALKSIFRGPASHAMFANLKTLIVLDCRLLLHLFPLGVAESLLKLEKLYVDSCPSLERIIEAGNRQKTVLPNLKKLDLVNLPKLYCPTGAADIKCPLLEHLLVVNCGYIQNHFRKHARVFVF